MNDPLFILFLGMSAFAVVYSLFIGYMIYQDTHRQRRPKAAKKHHGS